MWGLINIERKGYESLACYAYYVAYSYDIDLRFSRWNFEKICVIGMGGQIAKEK